MLMLVLMVVKLVVMRLPSHRKGIQSQRGKLVHSKRHGWGGVLCRGTGWRKCRVVIEWHQGRKLHLLHQVPEPSAGRSWLCC